jgi:DegV family protein with EDD domain
MKTTLLFSVVSEIPMDSAEQPRNRISAKKEGKNMYKIVIDSCGELTDEMKTDGHFCNVALTLDIEGEVIVDDDTFNQHDFLKKVRESVKGPHSACPSPESYIKAFEGDAENVYVITLSDKLSGSYNSAMVAASMYQEEHDDAKNIYVFNSRSASIGETLIGLKVQELENAGLPFSEICSKTEEYIDEQNTFFVLETLETFRKTGRISNVKALVANTLNIKPVMGSNDDGSIQQLGQARGMKKALAKMVEDVLARTKDCEHRVLAISHCNCPERAQYVKECIERLMKFKDIIILDTAGVSSMYANDGGVIIAV